MTAALECLCDELKKEQRIETKVRGINVTKVLPLKLQLVLFRIAQAALSNVRRHAQASNADIILEMRSEQVKMIVSDNGKGFQSPSELGSLVRCGS